MTQRIGFITVCTALLAIGTACSAGVSPPAELDPTNDTCTICRMAVSDRRVAAQVVERGEEPRFFDDIGCLAKFLAERGQREAAVYVADHRTGEWTPAASAVYSRLPRASTPMASGLVAHATQESRAQDAEAGGSVPVEASSVIGDRGSGARVRP